MQPRFTLHRRPQVSFGRVPSPDHADDAAQSQPEISPSPSDRSSATKRLQDASQALDAWLTWNDAYEHLTERMFRAGHDPDKVEALAEEVDTLREEAVRLSREIDHRAEVDGKPVAGEHGHGVLPDSARKAA